MDQPWFRFHSIDHSPIYWGLNPPRRYPFRFDSPNGEYGVLYVGADEHGAFVETFLHDTTYRRISPVDLATRALARIGVTRPLRLVDLSGPALVHLGADARLWTGDYVVSQAWALAFFVHPMTPDGIYYPSRHDNERGCAAIFGRVESEVTATSLGTLTDEANGELLRELIKTYRLAYRPP